MELEGAKFKTSKHRNEITNIRMKGKKLKQSRYADYKKLSAVLRNDRRLKLGMKHYID
jgi:hypothetical protein